MPMRRNGHHARALAVAVLATLLVPQTALCQVPRQPPAADLVITNAKVWTGVPVPAGGTEPTSVAVRDGKFAYVGTDDGARAYVGPDTTHVDANGRRVIPGITDSHTHMIGGGLQLARLSLREVKNREEFVAEVAAEAAKKKPGEWVQGGRWSVESWAEPTPPTKEWLDPVTRDVPVFLSRMDGHQALVNSAALARAGIDRNGPPDPEGGEIERDPKTGEPTGILKESAMGLVGRHIPDVSREERYEALKRAMQHANSLGITCVHDMCNPEDLHVYERAAKENALPVRIFAFQTRHDEPGAGETFASPLGDHDMVRLQGVKAYMDGSLGSRTAYMRAPYADAPPGSPYPRGQLSAFAQDQASFLKALHMVDGANMQIAIHAIGDEANHLLLDAYAELRRANGGRDTRHRIEHAQHLLVEDLPRFAELGVVASMQPYHKADDGRYAEQRLGRERLAGSYAFRQLVDAGALLVFGSDWPVVTMNPFAGMDSAVNAKTLDGKTWLPEHSLTVEEALRAYTTNPARAVHAEDTLGTIEAGKAADMVVLSQDILGVPANGIASTSAVYTIVAGEVVYRSE